MAQRSLLDDSAFRLVIRRRASSCCRATSLSFVESPSAICARLPRPVRAPGRVALAYPAFRCREAYARMNADQDQVRSAKGRRPCLRPGARGAVSREPGWSVIDGEATNTRFTAGGAPRIPPANLARGRVDMSVQRWKGPDEQRWKRRQLSLSV
jgi:hypothetical protein